MSNKVKPFTIPNDKIDKLCRAGQKATKNAWYEKHNTHVSKIEIILYFDE